ncbi:hypothetical protein M407DRAFT_29855 [Tulasnella calospora MUT 4182]|uniref:Uncharacterized protein n=1 Tax=Tulasnella calospora MUT 4182 TaxID=1051891 RepID=A0A0C3Q9B2_9AGAM|nr:hypothetical protein M407DRAFT_29855 [Tulasnella calospora MUT 4182]
MEGASAIVICWVPVVGLLSLSKTNFPAGRPFPSVLRAFVGTASNANIDRYGWVRGTSSSLPESSDPDGFGSRRESRWCPNPTFYFYGNSSRAKTLDGLGDVRRSQRKYVEAEESYTQAQEIYVPIGDEHGRANTIQGLGDVYHAQSKYAEANESSTAAQEIYTRIDHDLGRANTLHRLSHLYREQGRKMEAVPFYAQARDLYSQIGHPDDERNAFYWSDTVSDGGNT